MLNTLSAADSTPVELRDLVKWSVSLLGEIIEKESGKELYRFIEALRLEMAELRNKSEDETFPVLQSAFQKLKHRSPKERAIIARSYTLMLELMNACENAYRSHRLKERTRKEREEKFFTHKPDAIIYVLTAHPTEARSPESIAVFRLIQRTLTDSLDGVRSPQILKKTLFHQLELVWRVHLVRERAPKVIHEAEHIYSTLLENETLTALLETSQDLVVPIYFRSWVGGDKDGHPGVDDKVMRASLGLSREYLVRFVETKLKQIRNSLLLMPSHPLHKDLSKLAKSLSVLKKIKNGDGAKIEKFRLSLATFSANYTAKIGAADPVLRVLKQLLHVFPGFVVPLELRESSDVLMSSPKGGSTLAIDKMLRALALISKGGDPRWYARGFIVSMTESIEHLRVARAKVNFAFGGRTRLPVIPLFERLVALKKSSQIVGEMISDLKIGKDLRKEWGGSLEIMVGYSDSSKESGVLPSRLAIATAMNQLDDLCTKNHVHPVFFQGSGGSVDRGGGSIEDQTAWWPRSALRTYKVTIQGEMVERSLSSPEITRGQIERIRDSASRSLEKPAAAPKFKIAEKFAASISDYYQAMIQSPDFLSIVEKATPYPDLSELKIGSRPTRRATELSVKNLRAIPWILCWTQTRVLFPTWWGVGSAWKSFTKSEQNELREAFLKEPVFTSYVRALGFTLAKVELSVWKVYLKQSSLTNEQQDRFISLFQAECKLALAFLKAMSGSENPVWFRPWLGASIRLRSPMIHPLNLLQIIAIQERNFDLLRTTVTGISSGMLTTG